MSLPSTRVFAVGLAMLLAAGLALAMKPTRKLADERPKIDLETLIPKEFPGWRIEGRLAQLVVSPDVQAALDKIYNQTLSRTYVNAEGYRVMLSIAYGAEQNDSLQLHMPEGCYGGQGFAVQGRAKGPFDTPWGQYSVARLEASKGPRHEPITYWISVGGRLVTDLWEMKRVKLEFALSGEIPDGFLIRVSSIDPDAAKAHSIQAEFARAMLQALAPEQRTRLGVAGGPGDAAGPPAR